MSKKSILMLLNCAVLVTGCTTMKADSTWYRDYQDNRLAISSGWFGTEHRFITIGNPNRTWLGQLKGGKEMVEARKSLMMGVANQEAIQVCGKQPYQMIGEPNYLMMDQDAGAYGYGLLGFALANAMSSYDNLPVSLTLNFHCPNDSQKTS